MAMAALAICILSMNVCSADDPSSPLARWDFGTEETTRLVPHGTIVRDQPGPRPPEFPDFNASNTSVKFGGKGARFTFEDPGDNSKFDFKNGDEISLEAWVKVDTIGEGQGAYLIGKGRTGDDKKAKDNQNWAMRLRKIGGKVRINFLFASERVPGQQPADAHWHRWTSNEGLADEKRWHHVAVSYRFGEPDSIRGWIDGKAQAGTWDMGGKTTDAPVVDNDAVWIGSSMGGSDGASFRGWIDSVAIHRSMLDDKSVSSRFKRAAPLPDSAPSIDARPRTVRVTFEERVASHQVWPEHYSKPEVNPSLNPDAPDWFTSQFLFPRLPYRYDDWGIRESWGTPVLMTAVADVTLPAGKNQFMVRARGLSRLWVGDNVVVRTKAIGGSTDGHQPVDPLPVPPVPGMRMVAYGVNEQIGELELKENTTTRVILETIIGGVAYRAEPGELMVGIKTPDSDTFSLLQPAGVDQSPLPITDEVIIDAIAQIEQTLLQFGDRVRQAKASSQDEYWARRHQFAEQWVADHPAPSVPTDDSAGKHPIDRFVYDKISKVDSSTDSNHDINASRDFQDGVLPILQKHCIRCHGDKDEEGGFKVTSRESLIAGGDSGEPAITPGDPHSSVLLARIGSDDEGERMPPSAKLTDKEIETLTRWVSAGANWSTAIDTEALVIAPLVDDSTFLRRAYLDTVGVAPRETEARKFLDDKRADKRTRLIDQLLNDSRWADHWVSYWQDVLAENPNLLKPSLNNTGPFRWFLYETLRDNRPLDRMATELIMMRGSEREGGSAGFGMAADNDAPMATRGIVLASAFLGTQLQCARCHDSPYHSTIQRDLFSIAAMMTRSDVTVPVTSTVSPGFFEKNAGRESLIKVTLKPGEPVTPTWPFASFHKEPVAITDLVHDASDSRELLAANITAPANERFAMVMVNRLWKRLIGAGFLEPADDWETGVASHPELLHWLASELMANRYDAKHIVGLIMNSQLYQRQAVGKNLSKEPSQRYFAAPDRRRLTAEQVVDSMIAASGKPLMVDELSFDPEAKRPPKTMISLGSPTRGWMFATLSNERDRPSLAFPRATAVTDVLEAFGWTGSRQNALTDREAEPNVLQPGTIANGVFTSWMTSVSNESELANLAVDAKNADFLVESVFLRFLSRLPNDSEADEFNAILEEGFDSRVRSPGEVIPVADPTPLGRVSWSNHLSEEANRIKIEMERRARDGDPADPRLNADWRMRFEDVVWSVVNSPEFVWVP